MSLSTTYFPGDGTNVMLAKLLLLFGGTPLSGDGTNALLRKILQKVASESAGEDPVTTAEVNAAIAAQALLTTAEINAAITAAALKNFLDSADDSDAIVYHTGGTVEAIRVIGSTGNIQLNCLTGSVNRRMYLSNAKSALAVMSSSSKATGAYWEITGEDYPTAEGCAFITTINQATGKGLFKILNAPADSLVSATRFEVRWNGDAVLSPVWNAGATTFTGFEIDVTDTASATGSKVLDLQRSNTSMFSVNAYGNATQVVGSLVYAASVELDFDKQFNQTVTLDGDIEFTTAHLASGKELCVKILADEAERTLTFPADWIFVGDKPTTIAATKTAILSLKAYGAADANVVAAWGVEA